MKKKLLAGILSLAVAVTGISSADAAANARAAETEAKEVVLPKSMGNPMLGFDDDTDIRYAGDPAVMVDGDTVYAYAGFDNCSVEQEAYHMPKWICYSSKDMVNWTYESVIMEASDIPWAANADEAWAAQTIKHNGRYYFYYCTTAKNGFKTIGVAVADKPTGPFRDIGEPLVPSKTTTCVETGIANEPYGHEWKDIDPTVWVETDEDGNEHRYLMWGNKFFYLCELEEDMVTVKDQNKDGIIDMNDIKQHHVVGYPNGQGFEEAPWLYRRQDSNGKYYGKYYLFYAGGWREQMCYATADDIMDGNWQYGGRLMPPSATANTNHMAVFDFKGKSYFVYHNGSLAGGSGYRRVACVEEFAFNEDGSIDPIQETATGIGGVSSRIVHLMDGAVTHEAFENTQSDAQYPIIGKTVSCKRGVVGLDARWEINPGKADRGRAAYVSFESYNKPGMYLAVSGTDVVLSHDYNASVESAGNMTFRSVEGLAGQGVSFESVGKPGYYLVSKAGKLQVDNTPEAWDATFVVEQEASNRPDYGKSRKLVAIEVLKTKRQYKVRDMIKVNDLKVTAVMEDGTKETVTGYRTNAARIDMSTAGEKVLTVSYTQDGITATGKVVLNVADMTFQNSQVPGDTKPQVKKLPAKGSVHKNQNLKFKVTLSAKKNGMVSVVGLIKKNLTKITIPDTIKINGYTFKVTAVEGKAFASNKKLKTVTVGKYVKKIGKNAFQGIHKKAVFKTAKARVKALKRLLTPKSGFKKKTMKVKSLS